MVDEPATVFTAKARDGPPRLPGDAWWGLPAKAREKGLDRRQAVEPLAVFVVETRRIELLTFALRTRRSPS